MRGFEKAIAEWAARVIAEQTPVEPEFAAILYRNRSEMYLREQSDPPLTAEAQAHMEKTYD